MHHLIYIPKVRGTRPSNFERAGIEGLFDHSSWEAVHCAGPDGGEGMVYTVREGGKDDPPLSVDQRFHFHKSPPNPNKEKPAGAYWVGVNPESLPTPRQLARDKMIAGNNVPLCDGNIWMIPSAQYLPHHIGLNRETGEFMCDVTDPVYKTYCTRAGDWAMQMFEKEEELQVFVDSQKFKDSRKKEFIQIPLEDAWNHAVAGLSFNYRVNDFIVDLLGLFDDPMSSVVNVCMSSFDAPLIKECVAKKKMEDFIGIQCGSIF